MPREFRLPELAESVVEGEIVRWLIEEGEEVTEDQPVVEVMTDKVTVELPSPYSGVLEKRLAGEGEVVPVDAPIALFSDRPAGADVHAATSSTGPEPATTAEEAAGTEKRAGDDGDELSLFRASPEVDEGPVVQVRGAVAAREAGRPKGPHGRVLAVPAARKLAREMGIDIEEVEGSGPNGRIRIEDVRAHVAHRGGSGAAPTPRAGGASRDAEERVPLRGLRRAISRQMMASHLESVRTLHVDEADVGELVRMRERLKPMAADRGVKLSYLPFVMKAAVAALKAFPMINSSLDEESEEIVRKRYYNLGVAVATEAGLVVPVIHEVDRKPLLEVAREVAEKAERARAGKLASEDVRGGTFSITNIGSLGGLFSFPIINVPEAAILGVHSIKKRPVVLDDDSIVARPMLYLSLSFDHRLIDGAEAAAFTSYLIELLETPESLLLEV